MAVSAATKQLLWARAAGRCAVAECRENLILGASGDDPITRIADEAHIVAQAGDGGPRGAFPVPGGERDGYGNLILLCPTHHRMIDRQRSTWTVERLLQLKADHERWVDERLTPSERYLNVYAPEASIRETVHSTVMNVDQMPRHVYVVPIDLTESDIRPLIRYPDAELLAPYVVRERKLIAFNRLDDPNGPFRDVVTPDQRGAVEQHASTEWWSDADLSSWYVTLLNRTLNKLTGRLGLHLDKDHHRYYFEPEPPDEEGGDPRPRSVTYRPLNQESATKNVAWRPVTRSTQEPKKHWIHLAVALRFHKVLADGWVLSLRPEQRFTTDGYEPLFPKTTGRRAARFKSRLYNYDLLAELQFWREFLSGGEPRIILPFGEQQNLIIDAHLMSADVTWAGVHNDARPFQNVRRDDDLFTSAAYYAALGSDDAEVDDWELADLDLIEEEEASSSRPGSTSE
jgi:hypothetical protein